MNSENTITSGAARRVYFYRGQNLICFAGARYTGPEDSEIDSNHKVTRVVADKSNPLEVQVTQHLDGARPRTETWSLFES